MVEALVGFDPDPHLLDALTGELAAPHLLDVEVLSVLRRLVLAGALDEQAADQARRTLFTFAIHRHDVSPIADRIWSLRHQFTAYDAAYLALAEGLGVPLVTCDGKLATPGHTAQVRVVSPTRR